MRDARGRGRVGLPSAARRAANLGDLVSAPVGDAPIDSAMFESAARDLLPVAGLCRRSGRGRELDLALAEVDRLDLDYRQSLAMRAAAVATVADELISFTRASAMCRGAALLTGLDLAARWRSLRVRELPDEPSASTGVPATGVRSWRHRPAERADG